MLGAPRRVFCALLLRLLVVVVVVGAELLDVDVLAVGVGRGQLVAELEPQALGGLGPVHESAVQVAEVALGALDELEAREPLVDLGDLLGGHAQGLEGAVVLLLVVERHDSPPFRGLRCCGH